ncbi:hypothetical protein BDN72DRAFT_745861, partial [Pluteus cervinus]
MDRECRHCHALHWQAEKLASSSAITPEFSTCCNRGSVHLPLLSDPPPPLRALFDNSDALSREFRKHLWEYNRALAFTSLGVREDHHVQPSFRIEGELYHCTGALHPPDNRAPTYAQLYFLNGQQTAALQRYENNRGELRQDLLQRLEDIVREHNPYAAVYVHAHEVLSQYPERDDINVRLRVAPGTDHRRYNLPQADEVAVILPNDPSAPEHRDIVLRLRSGALHRINETHAGYTPLYYVLLFP